MTRGRSERAREAAFDRLFAEHRLPLLAYFLRRVDGSCDAADLLAEVFLVVWRRLDDVPNDEAAPWLFGVARRVLANHRRGVRRSDGLAVKLRSTLDRRAVPSPEAASLDNEAVARVRRALAALPDLDREIVTLRAWEGLSAADISLVVGGTPENIRVRLHRARSRLRRILELPDVLDEKVVP